MRILFVASALCAVLLSGCASSEDEVWAAAHEAEKEPVHVAAFVPDSRFCQSAARQQAPGVFDQATRSRMVADSYRQCVVVYAVNDTGLRVADLGGGTTAY